jgi:hypothetical protein
MDVSTSDKRPAILGTANPEIGGMGVQQSILVYLPPPDRIIQLRHTRVAARTALDPPAIQHCQPAVVTAPRLNNQQEM